MSEQNWLKLTTIQLGGAVCLPTIMIGTILVQHHGVVPACLAIIAGNLFLLLLALITAKMALENRKTTMENAKEYFGPLGGALFACVMAISMTGWFAIQLNLITLSVLKIFNTAGEGGLFLLVNSLIGAMITATAMKGMRSLSLLSDLSAPLLVGTLGYAVFSRQGGGLDLSLAFNASAVSLVIAVAIGVVVDLPTYFRHAKSAKDAYLSITLLFILIIPLIEGAGVLLSARFLHGDIIEVLKGDGGTFYTLWIALFLILAGWTTNATNLFSSVASLKAVVPRLSEGSSALIAGGAGSLLGCLDALRHFEKILELMGVAVTAMGAVVMIRYITGRKQASFLINFFSWGAGATVGIFTLFGLGNLTSIPQFDAFLMAIAAVLILPGGFREKVNAE